MEKEVMKLIKKNHFLSRVLLKNRLIKSFDYSATIRCQATSAIINHQEQLAVHPHVSSEHHVVKKDQPEILTLSGPRISSSFSSVVSSASIGVLRAKILIVSIASPA
jgi:hypothetical protein